MSDNTGNGRTFGDLAQEILDRMINDPDFRQQLLERPAELLKETGYPVSDEVTGYAHAARPWWGRDGAEAVTTAISCPATCTIKPAPAPSPTLYQTAVYPPTQGNNLPHPPKPIE